ncbi:arsenosugar biosynthesis radical SAM (seleno)protein ArsS [Candidatus Latescibacterota bacterium]
MSTAPLGANSDLIQIGDSGQSADGGRAPSFAAVLADHGLGLRRAPLTALQVNLGKRCNQACLHCHVDAGPRRTEAMSQDTAERVVELMDLPGRDRLSTVDITGGAPELYPVFRYLVREARSRGLHVIDRCNLTVLLEPGQEDTPQFLRDHHVEVVASLPCYQKLNVDSQRGSGVFEKSIRGLRLLNEAGYGQPGTDLQLNVAYNPVGPFLPPEQGELEADYRVRLKQDHDIVFSRLLTITNMPIHRFRHDLERSGGLQEYMDLLVSSFNPGNVDGLMCRSLVSISWDGALYDCDFHQMLQLPLPVAPRSIWDVASLEDFSERSIALADHCFGCTAGAGSSCGGQLS